MNVFNVNRSQCLPHGWYLAADFQLYVMSYFVIRLLYKRPRIGFAIVALGILATSLITAIRIHVYNTRATFEYSGADI